MSERKPRSISISRRARPAPSLRWLVSLVLAAGALHVLVLPLLPALFALCVWVSTGRRPAHVGPGGCRLLMIRSLARCCGDCRSGQRVLGPATRGVLDTRLVRCCGGRCAHRVSLSAIFRETRTREPARLTTRTVRSHRQSPQTEPHITQVNDTCCIHTVSGSGTSTLFHLRARLASCAWLSFAARQRSCRLGAHAVCHRAVAAACAAATSMARCNCGGSRPHLCCRQPLALLCR